MPAFTDTPYDFDVFTVKRLGDNHIKITYNRAIRQKGWELLEDKEHKHDIINPDKLDNNLSRARNSVREMVMCNPWDYWCTFTIDPKKYDRYNLKAYFSDFAEFLHNYNRRCNCEDKVKYLFVPEMHKDGAWHIHGFIKGIRKDEIIINKNGYLSWKQYNERFGFMSMDPIKDINRCSSYILKYMTKDFSRNVTERYAHLFYASKGLKRAEEIYRGKGIFNGSWDWEDAEGFCKIKTIDLNKENLSDYFKEVQF